ncbi:hypothetical protein [Phyllobacterium phragmitis]|uniref:hypothetical protein n=1 Tax=Phyllobacterium phragmitis TaxID=2670329 RepID=UPI000CFE9D05|nr:hypothetical protein [Phyllobacterium phragmitis]
MTEESLAWEFEGNSDRLLIHFGVDDHFIKLDTFIKTADSAHRIIKALDGTFFRGSLEYELIVLPPEPGTFLTKLAVKVGSGAALVFAFANTPIGSAYIEALTGQPPTYWGTQAGEISRNVIEGPNDSGKGSDEDENKPGDQTLSMSKDYDAACRASARIVSSMARGILEKETDQLARIGMEVGALPDAMDARADFYLACIENPDVKNIGFTSENEFPIPRSSFPGRALRAERKDAEDDPLPWQVSTESIYVTSPNWDQNDQKSRQWKGKDQIRRDCYFVIEDAEFWTLVKRKDLHVDVLDNLKVQWAFQIIEGRPKNRRVLRVLEFNGEKLAEPLTSDAIRTMIGQFMELGTPRDDGPSLFEWQP